MATMSDPMATMIEQSLQGITPPTVAPTTPVVAPEIPEAAPVDSNPVDPEAIETLGETEPETAEQLLRGVTDPNSSRGQRIWKGYTFARDLARSESEGGIGHEPSVEDVKLYHDNHLTFNRMLDDFEAQPGIMFAGLTKVNPEAAAKMVTELPQLLDALADREPHLAAAQEKLYHAIGKNTVQGILELGREATADTTKKWYFELARNLNYFLTGGKETLSEDVLSAPVDPLAGERATLEQERRQLEEESRRRNAGVWNGFRNDLFGALDTQLGETFSWPSEMKSSPFFEDVSSRAMESVRKAVGQSNIARQELEGIMGRAQRIMRAGGDPSSEKQAFIQTYFKYARPHVARIRADYIKRAGITKPVTSSAPPATAAHVSPSPSKPVRDPKEDYDAFASRVLNQALGIQ